MTRNHIFLSALLVITSSSHIAVAQIPSESSIYQDGSDPGVIYNTDIRGSLEVLNTSNYSPSQKRITIRTVLEHAGNTVPIPPYDQEILEFSVDGGTKSYWNIANHCVRSNSYKLLTCQFDYTLSDSDASKNYIQLSARYYARESSFQLSDIDFVWLAYSQNLLSKTIFCEGYANGGNCVAATEGGNSNPGSNTGLSPECTPGDPLHDPVICSICSDPFDPDYDPSSLSCAISTPVAAVCNPENDALLPTSVNSGGTFVFSIPVDQVCVDDVFWIDPPVAVGYTYEATGTQFTHVKMPSSATVPDPDGYELVNGTDSISLQPGESYEFPTPVSSFVVRGINPELETDPENQLAFPIGIDVTPPASDVTINQKPITEEYPPVSVNNPPIADAGSDISGVKPNQTISLDGTGSTDPDGDPLTYRWVQRSGISVVLDDPTSATPSFKVRRGRVDHPFVFELTVSDGTAASTSTVSVVHQRLSHRRAR